MITHRKAAATAFAFAMTTTSAWAGNACIQDEDLTALRATALQQQLMVAGYACHDAAEYNRFVEIYRSQLVSADAGLMAYFIHRNAATGSDDYNAFKTKLANIAAIRSANDTGEFCGHAHVAFRAAFSTEKASLKDLVAVQSDKAQPACGNDVKNAAATPVPVQKPAQILAANISGQAPGVLPVPKPELTGIPAGAVAPKPLTAEALAQMYPGDPPPFSLPTTPASANIPPIAAPSARVAVNDLARPSSSAPIRAMQEAQAPVDDASDGLDIAGPVEAALSAAPAFASAAPAVAQRASAPAELAATAVAQKQTVATAGQVVAAHAAGQLLQAPEALAAAAPAGALSDAEMQSVALSGVTAAEANAPAEAPPQRASAPRYAAAQAQPQSQQQAQYNAPPNANSQANSDDDDLPPLPRDSYARPDARIAGNDDDRYGPDNSADNRYANPRYANNSDDDAYAPPQRQVRSAPQPAAYRYYNDRFGNRYAEDARGQQYIFNARQGRWQSMGDGYGNDSAPSAGAYQNYAYSPYYRSAPPGYYGR